MANIKSAKKRALQSEKNRLRNNARKSAIKTAIKKVISALESDSLETVRDLMRQAEAKIARAKGKGLFHRNAAARKVSRLAKKIFQKERTAHDAASA